MVWTELESDPLFVALYGEAQVRCHHALHHIPSQTQYSLIQKASYQSPDLVFLTLFFLLDMEDASPYFLLPLGGIVPM